jgi:hypothetical protein
MNNYKLELSNLQNSMNYLHVRELKAYCEKFGLSLKGKKSTLIYRVIHFLKTGEKLEIAKYPINSISKSNKDYTPKPRDLILKGLYKNDLKTRLFFKSIIGQHFHFTAFGVDWLEQRWIDGNPPTYQEFANMWSKEYVLRKTNGSNPKAEWAYITFVKNYLAKHAQVSRTELLKQWELERLRHKSLVDIIINEK